jgi:uncharacterized protein YkwD
MSRSVVAMTFDDVPHHPSQSQHRGALSKKRRKHSFISQFQISMISHDIFYLQYNDVAEQPQKPLSKKQLSLMSYEPPSQWRHMVPGHSGYDFDSLSSTSSASMRSASSDKSPSDQRRVSSLHDKSNRRRLYDIMKSIRKNTTKHNSSNNNIRIHDIFKSITKKNVTIKKSSEVNFSKKKSIHQLESTKSRNIIPETSYYSSNHRMVNRERAMAPGGGLKPLYRSWYMDALAHAHVVDLAETGELKVVSNLESLLGSSSSNNKENQNQEQVLVGQNVQRGTSIRQMHESVMNSSGADSRRSNILRPTFTEFGMATALGRDGKLYMVQLFRGGEGGKGDNDDDEQLQNYEHVVTTIEEEEEFFC